MEAKYPLLMRILHWVIGLMIISLLAVGFFMADIPDDAPNKYDLYPLHKAFGFIVLILVLGRILVRVISKVPALPQSLAAWEVKLSHIVHILLYIAMITMTWSGYLMSSFFPHSQGLDLFGIVTVPDLVEKSEEWSGFFHEIHGYCAWFFVALLVFHIAGVIKHRFFDAKESDVLKRMM